MKKTLQNWATCNENKDTKKTSWRNCCIVMTAHDMKGLKGPVSSRSMTAEDRNTMAKSMVDSNPMLSLSETNFLPNGLSFKYLMIRTSKAADAVVMGK